MKVPISVLRYITELEEKMYSEEEVLNIVRESRYSEFAIDSINIYGGSIYLVCGKRRLIYTGITQINMFKVKMVLLYWTI
jgi:hypothetical protein